MNKQKVYIFGNWKMHMTMQETTTFMQTLLPTITKLSTTSLVAGIAPPFTSIQTATKMAHRSPLYIGAQNMSEHTQGAYTGEISSVMLKEIGVRFVIIGHSERRLHFFEDDHQIHSKIQRAIKEELTPLLCIGENQEERNRNTTQKIITHQLKTALQGFSKEQVQQIIIAYEPIWAIGTGKTATPQLAQQTHAFCRSFLSSQWGDNTAKIIPILYGGSVVPETISQLIEQPDIDGALIGGAALKAESFAQIIKKTENQLLH